MTADTSMQLLKDLIPSVLKSLQHPELLRRTELTSQWAAIAGPKIAPHTKPMLKNNGDLFVWVDQSVLAYELNQKYRQALLKRVQAILGEETVKAIHFRVGQLR